MVRRPRQRLSMESLEHRHLLAANLIKDINVLPAGARIQESLVVGDQIYFSAETAEHGRELWVSDGTAANTRIVRDINPGPEDATPTDLVMAGGHLFFTATSPGERRPRQLRRLFDLIRELWKASAARPGRHRSKRQGGVPGFPVAVP